jgi:RNA polymerase sigma factor (sigma-70 family)
MPSKTDTNLIPADTSRFATTHWSVVLAAGDSSAPQHREALSTLCQRYWFPLYAYLRRRGHNIHQAEDWTQAFFAQMLEKQYLTKVEPKPGKFRSFLLTALKHFLSKERDRAMALKRGGAQIIMPLDFKKAENKYSIEPVSELSPEKLFEKSWALTVLQQTMDRLEAESAKTNKKKLFDSLKVYLSVEKSSIPYSDVATELDMTEGAVRVAVHRLRRQYRELLRNEIIQTVATEEEIDEEIRDLFTALAP